MGLDPGNDVGDHLLASHVGVGAVTKVLVNPGSGGDRDKAVIGMNDGPPQDPAPTRASQTHGRAALKGIVLAGDDVVGKLAAGMGRQLIRRANRKQHRDVKGAASGVKGVVGFSDKNGIGI